MTARALLVPMAIALATLAGTTGAACESPHARQRGPGTTVTASVPTGKSTPPAPRADGGDQNTAPIASDAGQTTADAGARAHSERDLAKTADAGTLSRLAEMVNAFDTIPVRPGLKFPGKADARAGGGGASDKEKLKWSGPVDSIGRPPGIPAVSVTIEPSRIEVQGGLSREQVSHVIDSHRSTVRACYLRSLVRNPRLAGKLVLQWTIGLDGLVPAVKVKTSTLQSSDVAFCVMSNVRRWRFPQPEGTLVAVTCPIIMQPQGQ